MVYVGCMYVRLTAMRVGQQRKTELHGHGSSRMNVFWQKLATTCRKTTAREVCHILVAKKENNKEGDIREVISKGTGIVGAGVNVDVRLNVIAQRTSE